MNMNYSRWVNEVRRKLAQSGEPSPELLVARAERDLAGMYMAGETASAAASRLHKYRDNPGGLGIALGIAAVLGIGWLLLRKKDEPKPLPPAPTPIPPIDTSVPFTALPVSQWAASRGIWMIWSYGPNQNTTYFGLINQLTILFGEEGVPYFWSITDQNGQRVQDMLATNEYMAWYKATKGTA